MDTLHEVTDNEKVRKIAKSIGANGWVGAPMVTDGDLLITGVHRYAALRQIDCEDMLYDVTIPIQDIIEDYDAQIEERMDDGDEWYEAMKATVAGLDTSTREYYGLDAD